MLSRKNQNASAGFTFVHTLIVFVIIGLILAAVLSGARLYAQSQLFSNGVRMSIIANALNEFKSKYNAMPGDFGDSETAAFSSFGEPLPALPGCDNNPPSSCRGGDMDAQIGRTDRAIFSALNGSDAANADQENILFWYHLTASGLLNAVEMKSPTTSANAFGSNLPQAQPRGGYQVKAMGGFASSVTGDAAAPDGLTGLFIVWQAIPFARADQNFVITAHQAALLDRKYDDGKPLTGKIMARGRNVSPNSADGCRSSDQSYDETTDGADNCYVIFRIGDHAGF